MDLLEELYYDPRSSGSFGGVRRLWTAAKKKDPKITLRSVRDWLSGQPAYSRYKPIVRKFRRNRVVVLHKDDIWAMDLMEMQTFASENDGVRYLLIVIDTFSKTVPAIVPLLNKSGLSVAKALRELFSQGRKPLKVWTDRGTDFWASSVQNVFRDFGVMHYSTLNQETKSMIVERLIRTFRTRIVRYMDKNGTRRYLEALPGLIHSYQNTVHRSIGMAPAQVNEYNQDLVLRHMYGKPEKKEKKRLKIGDQVKMVLPKTSFEKGYHRRWTDEQFRVIGIDDKPRATYQLSALDSEPIIGSFYDPEVQKVSRRLEPYKVEKVLRRRRRADGTVEHLVKWQGLDRPDWTSKI